MSIRQAKRLHFAWAVRHFVRDGYSVVGWIPASGTHPKQHPDADPLLDVTLEKRTMSKINSQPPSRCSRRLRHVPDGACVTRRKRWRTALPLGVLYDGRCRRSRILRHRRQDRRRIEFRRGLPHGEADNRLRHHVHRRRALEKVLTSSRFRIRTSLGDKCQSVPTPDQRVLSANLQTMGLRFHGSRAET